MRALAGDHVATGLALRLADVDFSGEQIADRVAIAIWCWCPRWTGEEIQWAFRRLLERVADDAPLVIALDDLHGPSRGCSTCFIPRGFADGRS